MSDYFRDNLLQKLRQYLSEHEYSMTPLELVELRYLIDKTALTVDSADLSAIDRDFELQFRKSKAW